MEVGATFDAGPEDVRPEWAWYHFPVWSKAQIAGETPEAKSHADICPSCKKSRLKPLGKLGKNQLPWRLAAPECPKAPKSPPKTLLNVSIGFLALAFALIPIAYHSITGHKVQAQVNFFFGVFGGLVPTLASLALGAVTKKEDAELARKHKTVVAQHEARVAIWERCVYCPDCNTVTDPVTGKSVPVFSFAILLRGR